MEELKELLIIQNITTICGKRVGGSVMAWACRTSNRRGLQVFTDDVTADKSNNEF